MAWTGLYNPLKTSCLGDACTGDLAFFNGDTFNGQVSDVYTALDESTLGGCFVSTVNVTVEHQWSVVQMTLFYRVKMWVEKSLRYHFRKKCKTTWVAFLLQE